MSAAPQMSAASSLRFTDRSLLLGLLGAGIQLSRTPRMHEEEAAAQGIRCIYKLIDLQSAPFGERDLPDILHFARGFGFAGLNVTHPCKQAILPFLDGLDDDARILGAVNTVVFLDGRAIGSNTDWRGFAHSFSREFSDAKRGKVVLFGAGGAGAAVGYALLALGTRELAIIDPQFEKAKALAAQLQAIAVEARVEATFDAAAALADADGLVNATPLGTRDHPGMAFDPALLDARFWVADIVYFPLETELLRRARARGCRALSGGGMAVFQALEAFRLFTGLVADEGRMHATFRAMDADAA